MITRSESNLKIKENLLKSMKSLFLNEQDTLLMKSLKEFFPSISSAFIINCIPEQGEDIYWILIDPKIVAIVEIPRSDNADVKDVLIETHTVEKILQKPLTKGVRRELTAALELAKQAEKT